MIDQKTVSMARTMLQLQDAVNTKINANWRTAHNPWYRAIWTECAELLDHIGWKWWKKQHPNIAQVQLELIDIWHFGLSDILEKSSDYDAALKTLESAFQIFSTHHGNVQKPTFNMELAEVEVFAVQTLTTKTFNAQLFAKLAVTSGLSLQTIYIQYVGKNVLNRFRQDHGYNSGNYIKIWHGREDNEWLVELANSTDPELPSYPETLYRALAAQYAAVQPKNIIK